MLALKSKKIVTIALVFSLAILSVGLGVNSAINECKTPLRKDVSLQIDGKKLHTQISDDDAERSLGLGDRDCIEKNDAMLFVFDSESVNDRCFWMKDMKFSIDIYWLNKEKKVVDQALNVSPKDYPKIYCPQESSMYVIETNAGRLSSGDSFKGKQVVF